MVHERTQKRAIDCLRPRRANRHVQAEPWRPAFCVDAVTPGREYRLDRRDLSALGPTGARVTWLRYCRRISGNPYGKNSEFQLDPQGLNETKPEYYSVAFDDLSEEEARAYIEKYNRVHGDTNALPRIRNSCTYLTVPSDTTN